MATTITPEPIPGQPRHLASEGQGVTSWRWRSWSKAGRPTKPAAPVSKTRIGHTLHFCRFQSQYAAAGFLGGSHTQGLGLEGNAGRVDEPGAGLEHAAVVLVEEVADALQQVVGELRVVQGVHEGLLQAPVVILSSMPAVSACNMVDCVKESARDDRELDVDP